ncbi:MAG: hypothetical protein J6T23_03430 [Elusimicrobia bacterium]|nr:hypothetical protein [Elusimicrobiota bacterium]
MKKILSVVIALCFINLTIVDIYGSLMPETTAVAVSGAAVIANYPVLPEDIGKIVQDMYVLGNRTVINVQDLHADENTQKNIISILEFIVNNYNVQNIYFEGAIGDLDFGWLNTIKDEKLKKDIANKLLSEGKITGAEYFGFFNKRKDISFKGLEEEKVYKENFVLLEQMYENRNIIKAEMEQISDNLKQAAEKAYGYKLSFLNDLVEDYTNKDISQITYYSYLFKLLKDLSISQATYPAITEFLGLEETFESLNMRKLEKEAAQINQELKDRLPYEQYSNIQKTFVKYPNMYYNELAKYVSDNNLERKYSEFVKFTNFIKQKNSIDVISLLQEEKDLTDTLYDNFAKTVIEKNLVFLNSYTNKLLLLFTNSLPSFEYGYIKNNFNKYCILLENYISNTDITEIKQWYKTADKFYSNNEKRNLSFLENILKKKISNDDFVNSLVVKNPERKSFEEILFTTKQPVDIMVTGGYHSQGLKNLMAKLNINYAVVMPDVRLANGKDSEDKFYKDYLKQYSVLANTYQKFIRSSVMNTQWEDPVKVMVGTFFDYTVLQELSQYLKTSEDVTETLQLIEQHFADILKQKGLKVDAKITDIESVNPNSFVVTVVSDGKERLFYVSDTVSGEIYNKSDIPEMEKEIAEFNAQPQAKKSKRTLLKKISRYITFILVLPIMAVMGGGGGFSLSKGKQEPQPKKGLTNNGSQINTPDSEQIEYIDTVIEEKANVSLSGKIKLDNVFVANGNKLSLKAGQNTFITIKNIDMSTIGELDITIEDNGEYEITSEDGIVKVYKVLRTDFSSSVKKRTELVSVLKKGKVFLPNEANWENQNEDTVVVFYMDSSSWSRGDLLEKRSDMIYKGKKIEYINLSDITSFSGVIDTDRLAKTLKEKKLNNKSVCLEFSLLEERYSKPLMTFTDLWAEQTKAATFINTAVPLSLFAEKARYSFSRNNKHFYLNDDGTYKRYPYKDRNWLRSVLQKYFPSFEKRTFVFVWPVESVKYTYFTPKFADGGTPEQRVSAFEPFKQFMDKAREYSATGKPSVVFIPGYLITELAMYLENPKIGDDFVDITYGDSSEVNNFSVWYKKQDAKDIEKIEVLKLDGLTIVMYPEGNRGHNEQAYLKTLMATYNFGKESFDGMLTQAGYTWKANTVYVYEGKEMENLNMEAQLLKNPSIKVGAVTYVYENLKRVFIDLYSDMDKYFRTILPKFTKGNWIHVEEVVRETIDITQIKEAALAKAKLGFESFEIIPVKASLLNETDYGTPTILEQEGKRIPVYTLDFEGAKIYLVGMARNDILWQDCVLEYVKDFLKDYKNNIISFDGLPQISAARTKRFFPMGYVPVVLNSDTEINGMIEDLGYDNIVDTSDILARIGNTKLKYPHVASDMKEISEAIIVIKTLKQKSFFGQFAQDKTSYVGVKIASDEHIFNNEMEENEFIEILKGTDIDFVTVVIRDNDLGVHVLNRETTVKENLTKLSENLHAINKEIVLEYTFRFIDEFFKTFVRTIQEDCKDMNIDGIKLDLADCSVEDIGKTIEDLKAIRAALPDLSISLQVSNSVWEKYSTFLEELNITRTVSSKEELLIGEHDLSSATDVNYEISIYKNQQEYEYKIFNLTNQRERVLDKDPEHLSSTMRSLVELGEEKYADQIIDNRLENIFQKVVLNDSIGKLILPVNMLYAERLANNENSNVIQAVSNLIRLFKEAKGLNERRKFAYEFGLQQKVKLTDQQEQEIEQILRGESGVSAGGYVRKNFPYVFDYFVESRQTRIEISDSFLFGIYEANLTRKYKEGQLGKVLEFVKDDSVSFDTQENANKRQALFFRTLAQIYLYRDTIKDVFSMDSDEFKFYEGKNYKENYLNALMRELQRRDRIYNGMTVFEKGFPLLTKMVTGYMPSRKEVSREPGNHTSILYYLPNRKETLYEARVLMKALLMGYKTVEVEPVLPEIDQEQLQVEDAFMDENISNRINDMLASA